jgi:hypothetical protein
MIDYNYIFKDQKEFRVINSYVNEAYKFQPNETQGEFVNQNGQVVGQLIEANPDSDWFSVAGIFMGQITLTGIQYRNLTTLNHAPINVSFEA